MIEHLRGRDRKLEPLGWTGRDAEWIALVCLHSGVFTRGQFCDYFSTSRQQALSDLCGLIGGASGGGRGKTLCFSMGGLKTCRISSNAIYRALGVENIRHRRKATKPGSHAAAFVAGFCAGTSGYELAPRRAGEGRVF